jgi:predicted AlkP superfamily pyrophosphatase or phosphodiesterase
MEEVSTLEPLSKRIVFIVSDGLRSDSFYHTNNINTFLISLINQNKAYWGISNTKGN